MATPGGGKKSGKKMKGQTVSLNAFLGDSITTTPKKSWADEDEDVGHADLAEEYGGPSMPAVDLSKLPSAPRASRAADIDLSRLPRQPPYTAFLGNLPFDVKEEDIRKLFRGLKVENIRFPQEQGKMKGFGYAEFYDLDQLKAALALNNEKLGNRQIRVDIADQAGKDGRGGGFDDKTPGDWRRDENNDGSFGHKGNIGGSREDRRDGGFKRSAGPADTEDNWRRGDVPTPPQENGYDDKIRRGKEDVWGNKDSRYSNDKDRFGFRESRDRGGYREDQDLYKSDRGGFKNDHERSSFRDDYVCKDDQSRSGYRDDQAFRDGRDRDAPRERRKLNLKPRSIEEHKDEALSNSMSSSIFGVARPVDTAAKERQIEEKLLHAAEKQKSRGRGESSERLERDGSGDRGRGSSPGRNSYRSPPQNETSEPDDIDVDNWRSDIIRTDKTRVMKPSIAKDSVRKGDNFRARGSGDRKPAGRGHSPHEKKQKDGAVVPLKYEEPAKPDFVQKSKFAALGLEDDEDDCKSNSDTEELTSNT